MRTSPRGAVWCSVDGEGDLRERSDGRWGGEGRAYVITTDGREIRKSVYGKSWDDVHTKLTKLQADTMSGKRVASTSQTVGEYMAYWLEEHARHRVRIGTLAGSPWLIRMYLTPLFGKRKLTGLRPNDIRRGFFQLKQVCRVLRSRQRPGPRGPGGATASQERRQVRHPGRTLGRSRAPGVVQRPRRSACRTVVSGGTVRVTSTGFSRHSSRTLSRRMRS